jgi:hypothetical protein
MYKLVTHVSLLVGVSMTGHPRPRSDTEVWVKELENRLDRLGAKLTDAATLAQRSTTAGIEIDRHLSIVQELIARIEDRLAVLGAEAAGEAPSSDGRDGAIAYCEVPGFPGYRVGSDGTVWGSRRAGRGYGRSRDWRQLKPYLVRPGPVPTVSLYRDRVRHPLRVDTVVLLSFVGPCPGDCEARHANGDPCDNRLDNLRYAPSRTPERDL